MKLLSLLRDASYVLVFCLAASASAELTPHAKADIDGTQQYTYRKVGDRSLSIFVTRPTEQAGLGRAPAIVFFHGGGWTGGKPGQFTDHARYFSARGIVCFQVQYRLLSKKKNTDPPFHCIQDARAAIRWVRNHAEEWGVDPTRIASAGGSAGGHLAACLGSAVADQDDLFEDSQEDRKINVRSNAMLLFNPVYDNSPNDGWGTKRVADQFQKYSPAQNIDTKTPPAIVFLGDSDALIPVDVAKRFQHKMKDLKIESRLTIFPSMPHGFFNKGKYDNKPFHQTLEEGDQFLIDLGWLTGEPQPELFPK
ncbi:MAG: alpha/beta hydrolase [Fuerstiella sp.]